MLELKKDIGEKASTIWIKYIVKIVLPTNYESPN